MQASAAPPSADSSFDAVELAFEPLQDVAAGHRVGERCPRVGRRFPEQQFGNFGTGRGAGSHEVEEIPIHPG